MLSDRQSGGIQIEVFPAETENTQTDIERAISDGQMHSHSVLWSQTSDNELSCIFLFHKILEKEDRVVALCGQARQCPARQWETFLCHIENISRQGRFALNVQLWKIVPKIIYFPEKLSDTSAHSPVLLIKMEYKEESSQSGWCEVEQGGLMLYKNGSQDDKCLIYWIYKAL